MRGLNKFLLGAFLIVAVMAGVPAAIAQYVYGGAPVTLGIPLTTTGSGSITLTGAGSSTNATLPNAADTIVELTQSQTLTNKTLTSPTLTTPSLGVATATSINGDTFTTGTYTLTGSAGKTLTFSNTLTLAGTDSTTMTFPAASDTVAGLGTNQSFTNANTFSSAVTISGSLLPTGKVGTQGLVFGTNPFGNPLQYVLVQNLPTASVNTTGGFNILASQSGRQIFPTGLTVTASGTASGATAVYVQCGSGNILGSWPIAALITQQPITPFTSNGSSAYNGCSVGKGCVAFASGCAVGDGVLVSVLGSNLATTNNLYINLPYTIQ
jgi:hypothetical protein